MQRVRTGVVVAGAVVSAGIGFAGPYVAVRELGLLGRRDAKLRTGRTRRKKQRRAAPPSTRSRT
ncbi:hypothetical protein OG302_42700 [Streptomyces sp. NBC_01283]|uniref:hypothetical protein n=1 Tax=Streptomyces sp. NBC_01283 TaxID=2903812 RepID=UPI00352C8436|nr:hypothetical protein OG302_42700 [Streptomyces sp. NBC_01283]